jgi:hypothetical protein
MKIAPSRFGGNWTEFDWQRAKDKQDWSRMILIFKDRNNYRYLAAAKSMLVSDEKYVSPRLGFAIVALDCLLIETLNQFYRDKKESINKRGKYKYVKTSKNYRSSIDQLSNDGWYYATFFTEVSHYFQPCFVKNPKSAVIFYEDIRCGILHSTETGRKSLIRVKYYPDPKVPFTLIIDDNPVSPQNPNGKFEAGIIVYRNRFHELIIKEFAYYCHLLRNKGNQKLQDRFIEKMDQICRLKEGEE